MKMDCHYHKEDLYLLGIKTYREELISNLLLLSKHLLDLALIVEIKKLIHMLIRKSMSIQPCQHIQKWCRQIWIKFLLWEIRLSIHKLQYLITQKIVDQVKTDLMYKLINQSSTLLMEWDLKRVIEIIAQLDRDMIAQCLPERTWSRVRISEQEILINQMSSFLLKKY